MPTKFLDFSVIALRVWIMDTIHTVRALLTNSSIHSIRSTYGTRTVSIHTVEFRVQYSMYIRLYNYLYVRTAQDKRNQSEFQRKSLSST